MKNRQPSALKCPPDKSKMILYRLDDHFMNLPEAAPKGLRMNSGRHRRATFLIRFLKGVRICSGTKSGQSRE